MAYQTGDNMFAYSKYIVAPNSTQYDTIQAAINDANAAGGNVVVYIRPGTYTENLTLYSTVSLQGDSNELVTIVGVHTPPLAGSVAISFVNLSSATHIFSSAAAGAATITIRDCVLNCTNGYAFNLANWTARLTVANCTENSTDNHGVNNSGGADLLISNSNFGNSLTAMTLSGDVEIYASNVAAPLSVTGAGDVIIDNGSTLLESITLAGTATLTIRNSSLETAAVAAITTTSAGLTSLANVTIDSSAVPVLAGTGTIQFGEVTYLTNNGVAAGITKSYGTEVSTGTLKLDDATDGVMRATAGVVSAANGADGQVIIGRTAGGPSAWASITSTGGTITFTPGAATLNMETTAHATNWTTATTNAVAALNNYGYVVKNATPANLTTFTLPATAAVGDTLIITGYTVGGWQIAQNAGQQIFFGSAATTIGVGGSLASTLAFDTVSLVCVTTDLEWNVISSVGNITVV